MNLSNKLTVLRILFVPLLVIFLLYDIIPGRYIYAFVIFIIASYTDYLDGKIARKNNIVTDFGKFADPLADKCLVISAFVCFIKYGLIDPLAVVIVILREFTVTSVRLAAVESGKVISANLWGKVKTLSQILAVVFIIGSCAVRDYIVIHTGNSHVYNEVSSVLCNLAVWLSVVLSLISGFIYIYQNRSFIINSK